MKYYYLVSSAMFDEDSFSEECVLNARKRGQRQHYVRKATMKILISVETGPTRSGLLFLG